MFRIWPNQSDFVKRCPTCSELVAVKDLKKIPRQAEPRWYQLTPASHTACPHCGQLVVFTLHNSPLIIAPFILVGANIFAALFVPQIRYAFAVSPWLKFAGELLVLVGAGAILTLAVRRARLIKEP